MPAHAQEVTAAAGVPLLLARACNSQDVLPSDGWCLRMASMHKLCADLPWWDVSLLLQSTRAHEQERKSGNALLRSGTKHAKMQ